MKRPLAILTSALLLGVGSAALGGARTAAIGQVLQQDANYSGYSTGTVIHTDAAQLAVSGPQVASADVAFSGATVASKGTGGVTQGPGAGGGTIVNEINQVVQPALPDTTRDANLRGDKSFGRGSGLEVGLLNNLPADTNQVILAQRALASAPPSTDLITKQVGPVNLDPVAYASLLRGQAAARYDLNACILGRPLSEGLGYAADAQLLNSGTAGPDGFSQSVVAAAASSPERRVSQSRSTTRLVPHVDGAGNATGAFGLSTETRMTIAPVTLFKGQPGQLTIEFLGEWVLRATTTGLAGGASVFYGPGTVTPQTNVLSIIPASGSPTLITLQQLLGPAGINPINIPGVADIAIGEAPRQIGGAFGSGAATAADGTFAGAAVDVVRVKLLEQPGGASGGGTLLPSGLDVRIGHMEARAQVPAGGIKCQLPQIPVQKTADRPVVNAGESFVYTIKVDNPFTDCDLTDVRVVDTIRVEPGVKYQVTGTEPAANSTTNDRIVFDNIGPIPPGGSKIVKITVQVAADSASGRFTDTATATANCATGSADGSAKIVVPVTGEVTVVVPQANAGPTAVSPVSRSAPAELPKTGGDPTMPLIGLGLLTAAAVARRLVLAR